LKAGVHLLFKVGIWIYIYILTIDHIFRDIYVAIDIDIEI
jgi:hypothetical protein